MWDNIMWHALKPKKYGHTKTKKKSPTCSCWTWANITLTMEATVGLIRKDASPSETSDGCGFC